MKTHNFCSGRRDLFEIVGGVILGCEILYVYILTDFFQHAKGVKYG